MKLLVKFISVFLLTNFVVKAEIHRKNEASVDVCGKLDISGDLINKEYLNKLIQNSIEDILSKNSKSTESLNENNEIGYYPKNCFELFENGDSVSEIKVIYPWRNYPHIPETVYCDQETDGGGWTVIQRRINVTKREDFYRTWAEYRLGFGKKDEEFWLGNDLISELTSKKLQKLRIDLETYEGDTRWAKYGFFHVDDKNNKYKLSVGEYTGNSAESFSYHHGSFFTTKDQDNDKHKDNCATE